MVCVYVFNLILTISTKYKQINTLGWVRPGGRCKHRPYKNIPGIVAIKLGLAHMTAKGADK